MRIFLIIFCFSFSLSLATAVEAAPKKKVPVTAPTTATTTTTMATATTTTTTTTVGTVTPMYGFKDGVIFVSDQLVKAGQKGMRKKFSPQIRGNFNEWKDEDMTYKEGVWVYKIEDDFGDLVFCIFLGEERFLPENALKSVQMGDRCSNWKGSWNFYIDLTSTH